MFESQTKKFEGDILLRSFSDLLKVTQDDENIETVSTNEQEKVEAEVLKLYRDLPKPVLTKSRHISYLKRSLLNIPSTYECLDCSRPWLCYWCLHSLNILEEKLKDDEYSIIINFLSKCQNPDGGFGGGPGQYPHLASTYAAVGALSSIETKEAYDVINRQGLYDFLISLKNNNGSFVMHKDGESDIRAVYCALTVAKLTNIYTSELFDKTNEWISECQTWEGGFGGCPDMEAHGGYTYCGLSSLVLLGKTDSFNFPSLTRWLVNKQMKLEGGFQGRTNKLVDGCYSFWQCASFPLIQGIMSIKQRNVKSHFYSNQWLYDQRALQEYILICCQHPYGGLLDKPTKTRDMYHTCYVLSGLSTAQNSPIRIIVGDKNLNAIKSIHPVFNLCFTSVTKIQNYFEETPLNDLK